MKIVNWQSYFTSHQYYTWIELQKIVDEKILHVVAATTGDVRKKQGWQSLDLSDLDVVYFEGKGWWRQGVSIIKRYPEHIHVFGGFWTNKKYFFLMLYAAYQKRRVVVMDEPYATKNVGYFYDGNKLINQMKVLMRPLLYASVAKILRMISDVKRFSIIAVSMRAVDQFLKAGFSHKQLYPFGYFIPKLENSLQYLNQGESVRLIFVGNLLKTKGIDLAAEAIYSLCDAGLDVCLDIYGTGDPKLLLREDLSCVSYKGVIPFGTAQSVISNYDALILPSRHDGWGVVINEALLQGVPVLVSDHVGAKCLVESPNNAGLVFRCEDVDDMKSKIRQFVTDSDLRSDLGESAKEVGKRILPDNAARYMLNAFNHYYYGKGGRPAPIWTK